MSEIRWGFLGTGWIADVLAKDLQIIGRSVRAVGSRNLETAQQFAKEHDIELAFGSYADLCKSPDIDAIYIATPNPFHFDNAKLALEENKHVLVEKPFTLNYKQASVIVEVAQKKNLFLMEAMWSRFVPSQKALLKSCDSGELGELLAVYAEHGQYLPMESHRRLWDLDLGGGALLDLGVYPLALIQNILGAPVKVQAIGNLAATGADQKLFANLEFEGGRLGSFFTTMQVAGPANATVYGSKGRIEIRNPLWGQFDFDVFDVRGELTRSYHEEIVGTGRQFQILAAEEAIAKGALEHELMPLRDTLSISKTMDEIRLQIGVRYSADENFMSN